MELNAAEGNLYLTAKEIFESFEEMAFQKQIGYTFWSHSRKIPIWYDYEKIEKNLKDQGLLENEIERVKSVFGEKIDAADFRSDRPESVFQLVVQAVLADLPEKLTNCRNAPLRDLPAAGSPQAIQWEEYEPHR